MFCIYEDTLRGGWHAELVMHGCVKLAAKGKTPYESLESLFAMIGEEDDSTGSSAVEDGAVNLSASDRGLMPNCS